MFEGTKICYFVKCEVGENRSALLTVSVVERNKFIFDALLENAEVKFHIYQYPTTHEEMKRDLKQLYEMKIQPLRFKNG